MRVNHYLCKIITFLFVFYISQSTAEAIKHPNRYMVGDILDDSENDLSGQYIVVDGFILFESGMSEVAYLYENISDFILGRKFVYVELTKSDYNEYKHLDFCGVGVLGYAGRNGLSNNLLITKIKKITASETVLALAEGSFNYKTRAPKPDYQCYLKRILHK
ncbi:hypothetical protein Sden_0138 [Shewanella denitrificans OS217]|jgi:hypothetical protein|uniref:Uncharacterized protein n=1 Tax=Shewanella denitrificans (strain OS217 / ATCC BAA-1090 / DSM 15013) TaxID=318161 RepID=Q12SZ1_SHEDO|nr:hypothetical protein [Shewanella denitrificans]ABE53435.1 hypothetical protein Sden_0138 [Shewanella denitrificans OS217]